MMTLEEAIKLLKQYQGYDPMFPDGETLKHAFDLTDETVDTLLAALRPVSREQVEKVWRGEWREEIVKRCDWKGHKREYYQPNSCSKCHKPDTGEGKSKFCPNCGAPMTDEAVQMVMERLKEVISE